ncbi:Krueppel-like factor luna isoform X4 [Lucilia sericata]|uniref:Krueppel-like factor luna isoform X4 n=1 Tax=Lucilia sericata TaxID=13632 RepID=UPI0018A870B7|nr:Krueppel-like factor luna isoform X4 [Lucilia sericata]
MDVNMDILPSGNIFSELERICTTGYFSSQPSIEDQWQQVIFSLKLTVCHRVKYKNSLKYS